MYNNCVQDAPMKKVDKELSIKKEKTKVLKITVRLRSRVNLERRALTHQRSRSLRRRSRIRVKNLTSKRNKIQRCQMTSPSLQRPTIRRGYQRPTIRRS